jgi:hypothetical protein
MLPIIRLTQPNTPITRQHFATPGQWVLYHSDGENVLLNSFKMLLLGQRQIMVHFDLYSNHYLTARQGELDLWGKLVGFKLAGKNVADGLETFVWLPHYKQMGIIQTTARSGVRKLRNLSVGELYGLTSRVQSSNGRTYHVPSPERLNLPIILSELPSEIERRELLASFSAGLAV